MAIRITSEGLDIGTANRDIGSLNRMLTVINEAWRLRLEPAFAKLRIQGGEDRRRTAYDAEFVQRQILRPGMFDDLNKEARHIIYLNAETGLRLAEGVNLNRDTILLDCSVPHVCVRPDGRRLKTQQSRREIPLVGVALEVMKLHPDGFPRYRDKAASLSALVNKALSNRGLRLSENHSLYSLRHTFEDRLTAVEAPEKMIAELMGHKHGRLRYGQGYSLAHKAEWLRRIAFVAPFPV